ncbi:hypothetical protein COCNU_06G019960 [Cocos nucifera]|uniref:Uncharacterized protein n=1 Tax=Cocos nucifera TaxID=13894 RepID=A0A8K0IE29_COCNU|nr:hypothetical protein COCNU_06G019960 [Cocos nucifera]
MGRQVAKVRDESKKMWHIGGAAILMGVLQFSIGFVTVAFAGHLGAVELAAVSIAQNVVEGFAYGILAMLAEERIRTWGGQHESPQALPE